MATWAFRTVLWYYCGMDLEQIPAPDLQARNRELLQIMYSLTQGSISSITREQAIAEKCAIQTELRRRGIPIRPETRVSTEDSKRLSQRFVPTEDPGAELTAALEQVAALQAENARLRGQV